MHSPQLKHGRFAQKPTTSLCARSSQRGSGIPSLSPPTIYIYVYVKHLTAWCTGLRWLWVNEQNAFPMWMWVFSRGEGLLQDRFDGLWLQKGRPKDPQLGVRFSSHARHSRKTLKGILFWSIIDPPCTVPS